MAVTYPRHRWANAPSGLYAPRRKRRVLLDSDLTMRLDWILIAACLAILMVGMLMIYSSSRNIVHGDALAMTMTDGEPITFAEWGYLGKGKFQRRDFRYDTLVQMSSFGENTLFGDLGKHEIFTPIRSYPPQTIAEMAE